MNSKVNNENFALGIKKLTDSLSSGKIRIVSIDTVKESDVKLTNGILLEVQTTVRVVVPSEQIKESEIVKS